MKASAIVYTSNTGYTNEYAALLGQKTGLAVYALPDAINQLPSGIPIIYLGWIMAGKIKGYGKAAKKFRIAAVCGVGMGGTGSQIEDLQKGNALPLSLPVFTLQGGFDMKRLHGVYKLMMTLLAKTVGKELSQKENPTPEEADMLDMLMNGGNRVSQANLTAVLDWYNT